MFYSQAGARPPELVSSGCAAFERKPESVAGIFGVEMGVFAHPVTGQPIGYVQ